MCPSPTSDLDREAREAWKTWLRTIRWDLWASGTFRNSVTDYTALRVVRNWLEKRPRNWLEQYPELYAAIGIQRGPLAEKFHAHVLIGGTANNPRVATHLRASWVKDGHMKVEAYRHSKGGAEYAVNQADEIELFGTLQPYVRRRKGTK